MRTLLPTAMRSVGGVTRAVQNSALPTRTRADQPDEEQREDDEDADLCGQTNVQERQQGRHERGDGDVEQKQRHADGLAGQRKHTYKDP
jgi:Sec-independent protein translocase protein TatA